MRNVRNPIGFDLLNTIGSAPICMSCRHLHEIGLKCDAFPAGIPKEIIFGSWDHTRPVPGDNGIAFEPKD